MLCLSSKFVNEISGCKVYLNTDDKSRCKECMTGY